MSLAGQKGKSFGSPYSAIRCGRLWLDSYGCIHGNSHVTKNVFIVLCEKECRSDTFIFCHHCVKLVPRSMFYQLRGKYFINGKWICGTKDGDDALEEGDNEPHDAGDEFL